KAVNRQPEYLFVYAPTSFGWRDMLLHGSDAESNGVITPASYDNYVATLTTANKVGAGMVAIWVWLFFLLILGFAYSYFWTASTIFYLLMRQKVDDTELNEVYLEEEETEGAYTPFASEPATMAEKTGPSLTMVDSPSLKSAAPSEPRSDGSSAPASEPNPPS